MSDRRALVAAILAHPADDLPRLAFADWLDDHGDDLDRARAEFVRVQCDLARLPPDDPTRPALIARETTLIDAHARAWVERLLAVAEFDVRFFLSLPSGSDMARAYTRSLFARGFLRGLHFYVTHFVSQVGSLVAHEPVGDLWLELNPHAPADYDDIRWVVGLADCRWLRLVSRISGSDWAFGLDRFTVLIRSPHLRHLHTLELYEDALGWDDGSRGVRALVESPAPFRLRKLELNGVLQVWPEADSASAVEAARLLAGSHRLASLGELELPGNGFGPRAVELLIQSPYLRPDLRLTLDADERDDLPDDLRARLTERFVLG